MGHHHDVGLVVEREVVTEGGRRTRQDGVGPREPLPVRARTAEAHDADPEVDAFGEVDDRNDVGARPEHHEMRRDVDPVDEHLDRSVVGLDLDDVRPAVAEEFGGRPGECLPNLFVEPTREALVGAVPRALADRPRTADDRGDGDRFVGRDRLDHRTVALVDGFEKNGYDPVTTHAVTPERVVATGEVVGLDTRLARLADLAADPRDLVFETARGDRPRGVVGPDQHLRTRSSVGAPLDVDHRREHVVAVVGERVADAGQYVGLREAPVGRGHAVCLRS